MDRLSFTSAWKPAARCPAAWKAERDGLIAREVKPCYATGSLFHAALLTPDRVSAVLAEYGDLLVLQKASKTGPAGSPNAAAREAQHDGLYVRQLPAVAALLNGAQCEVEITFALDGVPWVAHVDCITAAGCILDAKTCRDIEGTEWCPVRRCRRPWHETMLYWHQLAVYRHARGPETVPAVGLIACQSFDDGFPAVRIIERAQQDADILDRAAEDVALSMRHEWVSPLTGRTLPPFAEMLETPADDLPRCESPNCAWCRRTPRDIYYTYSAEREPGL